MNNDLSIYEKFNVSNMSDDELDFVQQQLFNRKIKLLSDKVENIENLANRALQKVGIVETELNNKIEDLHTDNDKKLEVTINQMRVDKNKWGFGSQSDFGIRFRVSIGSKTVGKLFKIIGIAKVSKGKTEPKREAIMSGKATTEIINGYEVIRWHHEKCLKTLEKWLLENDLLEEFYSIDKEKELMQFINDLYDKYIDDEYLDN